jgi:release factor glutamine methyltransferase
MTLLEAYQYGLQYVGQGAVESYALRELLRYIEGFETHSDLIAHFDRSLQHKETFLEGLDQLKLGKPVAYIVGSCDFFNLTLQVNQHVLIPRQETEELVSLVLDHLKQINKKNPRLLDVATGSGAIALAVKANLINADVYASDISEQALVVATENAKKLQYPITFKQGDMLEPWSTYLSFFDGIMSNPPYIEDISEIDPLVLAHEPLLALHIQPATKYYQAIITHGLPLIKADGFFAFEISDSLAQPLVAWIKGIIPYATIRIIKDINNKQRMLFIQLEKGVTS